MYCWHADGFDLPEGAELLATGAEDFPNQAYRYGKSAVGLQFHPEVTYHMMCRWTIRGAERLSRPGAQPRPRHLGGWFQHDGRVAAWLEAFLPAWIEGRLGEESRRSAPDRERPEAGRGAATSPDHAVRGASRARLGRERARRLGLKLPRTHADGQATMGRPWLAVSDDTRTRPTGRTRFGAARVKGQHYLDRTTAFVLSLF